MHDARRRSTQTWIAALGLVSGCTLIGVVPDEIDSLGGDATGELGDGDGDLTGDGDGDPGTGDGDGDGDNNSTTGDGDGDSTGDGDGDPNTCGEVSLVTSYTPPALMFVVDASSTMVTSTWDHDGDAMTPAVTRWSSVHAALAAATAQFDAAMTAGVQRFPAADACPNATPQAADCDSADACITGAVPELDVGPGNAAMIAAALPGPGAGLDEVAGGTPASRAMDSALAHLLAQPPEQARHVVLITDGAANCNQALMFPDLVELYDDTLVPLVGAAFTDEGVTTHVVGVEIVDALQGVGDDGEAEANPWQRLDELAMAGGAPFLNATKQGELVAALTTILDEAASCTVDLTMNEAGPPLEDQRPFVSFELDGREVPRIDLGECGASDGWAWIDEGLVLSYCGSYCDAFRQGDELEGHYGCPVGP